MTHNAAFLSSKLIGGSFAVAFASTISQLEQFSGSCGINTSYLHAVYLGLSICALVLSIGMLVNYGWKVNAEVLTGALSISYLAITYAVTGGELLACDWLLVEAGLILAFASASNTAVRMFIAKSLISVAISKFIDCDGSWLTFSSLKSDALNQPFPFTPVWHLAQLPDQVTDILSILILTSEVVLPILLMFTSSAGPLLSVLSLCGYYAAIGNFNWTVLVLAAFTVRLLPADVLTLILGEKTFVRWGQISSKPFNESDAESMLIRVLIDTAKVSGVLTSICIFVYLGLGTTLSTIPMSGAGAFVAAWVVTGYCLARVLKESGGRKSAFVVLVCLALPYSALTGVLTMKTVAYDQDFSTLPTCYTFPSTAGSFPVHSRHGRAVFLFQTKYSQVGTNTVGNNLGGVKYAELSLPGSVHGDETRPPFLLGHLPRLALKLWRMGTGRPKDVGEGLALAAQLERIVGEGSEGIRVMFPGTHQVVLDSLVTRGVKKNQIQSFYQVYQVTHRAADHQWWNRSGERAAALPTNAVPEGPAPKRECSVIVPPMVKGVSIDLILLTLVAAALVGRLLFSADGSARKSKRNRA